jgi:hypothetical protein
VWFVDGLEEDREYELFSRRRQPQRWRNEGDKVIQRLQQGMAGNAIAGGIMKLSLFFFFSSFIM